MLKLVDHFQTLSGVRRGACSSHKIDIAQQVCACLNLHVRNSI